MSLPFVPVSASPTDISIALAGARTQTGKTLAELSEGTPLLLIFLRQFG